MKILLIDDDAFLLKVLERQLGRLGFDDVTAYARAGAALAMLETHTARFDLVLCDLQMPEMDGIEVLRHVARLGYTGGIVVMSGENPRLLQTAQSLARAHALNVLGTLQKPVSQDRLQAVLAAAKRSNDTRSGAERASYSADELRDAIVHKELLNHYQPKVEMSTGKVVGVESLVRWQHPSGELVYPDRFISIAEDHNFIDDLTFVVLSNAMKDVRDWHRAGWPLSVAVNVSMHNLVSLQFPDLVVRTAEAMGVPVTKIVLEVTESQLMSNPLASLDILTRLQLKHITLSIDDFGTGYSSLSQLRDIPFNELKVDRSFVHGAHQDSAAMAIVNASFDMAKQLGMTTIAEGAEDQADWDWLLQTGACDLVQGYFIAKPMPAGELLAWLTAWEGPQVRQAGGTS